MSESYFKKKKSDGESKLEIVLLTVLWLNPIQLAPITFLSCPSQSGSGEPQKPGKEARTEIPGVGEGPARIGMETAYRFGLDPKCATFSIPNQGDNSWHLHSEQEVLAGYSLQWRQKEIKQWTSDHQSSSCQWQKFSEQTQVPLGSLCDCFYKGKKKKTLLNVFPS